MLQYTSSLPRHLLPLIAHTASKTFPPSTYAFLRTFPRAFTTTTPLRSKGSNRIYTSIRTPSDLQTLLLLSSSSHQPLLTLWTASWAPSSIPTLSLLTSLISDHEIGENIPVASTDPGAVDGAMSAGTGVGLVEVEADAPDNMAEDLMGRYMVTRVPLLMAFSRGEAQMGTRVEDVGKLGDKDFLKMWIEKEAARGGGGGAGGSLLGRKWSGWFGGS